jgi:hypothetical protein
MLGLGLLNVLCCVMLPMSLIGGFAFLIDFHKLFQILTLNISVGMLPAQVRGVGSATPQAQEVSPHDLLESAALPSLPAHTASTLMAPGSRRVGFGPIQDANSSVRFELASPRQPESQPKVTGQTKLRLV